MTLKEKLAFRKKLAVLEYAELSGRDCKSCRFFEVPRSTFYRWKKVFAEEGESGLIRKKPVAWRHPKQVSSEAVEKILYLRKTYHLGPQRIAWYMERYHGIAVSCASVYRILARHDVSRLPKSVGRRAVHTHRYVKQVPGHHVQVDVKFLSFKAPDGKPIRRFQYTAIDDATRIRALKIYCDTLSQVTRSPQRPMKAGLLSLQNAARHHGSVVTADKSYCDLERDYRSNARASHLSFGPIYFKTASRTIFMPSTSRISERFIAASSRSPGEPRTL